MKKILVILVLLFLGAYFIWPTRYQEYAPGVGPHAEQIGKRASRVDRISGEVYVFNGKSEWERVDVRRPELLRPDITGPQPETRSAGSQARQQREIQNDMLDKTNEMLDEAVKKAKETP
jgi:hypothetical protein